MSEPLYNTAILRLAAAIPNLGRLTEPDGSAVRRSPICGSQIAVDVMLDDADVVSALGLDVKACALGQASASLMSAHVQGRAAHELIATRDALNAYLEGRADSPGQWPGLDVFAAARPHKARHGSILLAFDTLIEAVNYALVHRSKNKQDRPIPNVSSEVAG